METIPSAPSETRAASSASGIRIDIDLGHVARGGDDPHPSDRRGEVRKPRTGAVGRGRERPGERLAVDVTLVFERKTVLGEHRPERVQLHPGLDGDQATRPIRGDQPLHPGEVDHDPVGARDVGERVPGADRPHG